MEYDAPRVFSIQSHVVHGHVGNKSAVFPLQLLGFEVDFINSVQFSNHTGYPGFKGSVMTGQMLQEVYQGLIDNGLNEYQFVLTGYIGALTFMQIISGIVKDLKKANPNLIYVCDPVMGDEGKIYVKEDMIGQYKQLLVEISDVCLPNATEAELITNKQIDTVDQAKEACNSMHELGPKVVVLTSLKQSMDKDFVHLIGSTNIPQKDDQPRQFIISIPRYNAYFTGTGDLTSALILANLKRYGFDQVALAVTRSVGSVYAILDSQMQNKQVLQGIKDAEQANDMSKRYKYGELQLIKYQKYITDPKPLEYKQI